MANEVTFDSVFELIAAAVDDARGDSLVGGMRIREALAADPAFRAAVAAALVDDAVMRIAEDIERDLYPRKRAVAF
ncbi:hypothetical protein [Methylobacterium sp. SD21]|uniref:hypothetical protein n=1 Tax=Methylobacterium litchii TaxID=3138810 RepID=UPI00313E7EBD